MREVAGTLTPIAGRKNFMKDEIQKFLKELINCTVGLPEKFFHTKIRVGKT